jgi:hypothetical protein
MTVAQCIIERKIDSLYHFTTMENLFSIMEREYIYSRTLIDKLKLANDGYYTGDYVDHMDAQRLDGLRDFINLSLSRPNWYLLNKYSKRPELSHFDWCILQVNTQPMLQETTLFSVCNAASHAAKSYGVNAGLIALNNVFREQVKTPSKIYYRNNLPQHFTTDIQAEVLIKDQISIQYIKSIFLPSEAKLKQYQSAFNMLSLKADLFAVNQPLFTAPIFK